MAKQLLGLATLFPAPTKRVAKPAAVTNKKPVAKSKKTKGK